MVRHFCTWPWPRFRNGAPALENLALSVLFSNLWSYSPSSFFWLASCPESRIFIAKSLKKRNRRILALASWWKQKSIEKKLFFRAHYQWIQGRIICSFVNNGCKNSSQFCRRVPPHRRSQGVKEAMPPKFVENIVILCFENRFSKQSNVIRLQSNILTPPQIFGLATPLFRCTHENVVCLQSMISVL